MADVEELARIVGAAGYTERTGLVGLDIMDIEAVVEADTTIEKAHASAVGEGRAAHAAKQAVFALGEERLKAAHAVFIVLTGDSTFSMDEIASATHVIEENCSPNVKLLLQAFADGKEGELTITLVASLNGMIT